MLPRLAGLARDTERNRSTVASLVKVLVLGHNDELERAKSQNLLVGSSIQTRESDVRCTGKQLGDLAQQPAGGIGVKKDLRLPETSLRSRSAAKARQA